MGQLTVFNFITLNGFFKGEQEDISWHKQEEGEDEAQYAREGIQSDSILLFGRKTYEMMADFWRSEQAKQMMPEMAEGMTKSEKYVVSRSLITTHWENSQILSGDIVKSVSDLKQRSTKDITILGSGTVVSQLADAGLIDLFEIMMDPMALGAGTPIFNGIQKPLELKLVSLKQFKSGRVVFSYRPDK